MNWRGKHGMITHDIVKDDVVVTAQLDDGKWENFTFSRHTPQALAIKSVLEEQDRKLSIERVQHRASIKHERAKAVRGIGVVNALTRATGAV